MGDVFMFQGLDAEVDLHGNPLGLGFCNARSMVQIVGGIV